MTYRPDLAAVGRHEQAREHHLEVVEPGPKARQKPVPQ